MNKNLNRIFILSLFLSFATSLLAVAPNGYYKTAEGLQQKALLKRLCDIVGPHTTISYKGLWTLYKTSDVRPGTQEIWDMYSTAKYKAGKDQCGAYHSVGDCYNREHSFPKSWFNDASPMVSDAFHIYPTDGVVNNQRSNYPYGECANGTTLSAPRGIKALGKLGTSTFPGYSETVFEPIDEYKGDFARSYFYMAACYNDRFASFHSPMLAGNDYPCYTNWAINLLMKWHRQDPVSEKEIDRNDEVYAHQKNRNPFIDHPELAEYIWGNKQNEGWVPGGVIDPVITSPVSGTTIDLGVALVNTNLTQQITVKSAGLKENLNVTVAGTGFSVSTTTISKDQTNGAGANITVSYQSATAAEATGVLTISSAEVSSQVNLKAMAVENIVALPAEGITMNSFTARWQDMSKDGSNYNLYVYLADGVTVLPGYPKTVAASAERYNVTDLDYSATYKYKLTDKNGKESNVITVTTNDPIREINAILPQGDLVFNTTPNTVSDALPVDIACEYILEKEVNVTITGNFEISSDKANWSKSLTVSSEGERIYVRMQASAAGSYKGMLSASTATVEGFDIDVIGSSAAPRTFFEDFEVEAPAIGGYNTSGAEIQGNACKWYMKDAGLFARPGQDRYNGTLGVCTGKTPDSYIEMRENKLNGAGIFSFQAALYGKDTKASVDVLYSINEGRSWTKLQSFDIQNTILEEYVVDANIQQPIRFKIAQTAGKRINIDDIAISDVSSVENIYAENKNWDAYVVNGKVCVELENAANILIYTPDAKLVFEGMTQNGALIALPQGVYIVVNDAVNDSRKVIVK